MLTVDPAQRGSGRLVDVSSSGPGRRYPNSTSATTVSRAVGGDWRAVEVVSRVLPKEDAGVGRTIDSINPSTEEPIGSSPTRQMLSSTGYQHDSR